MPILLKKVGAAVFKIAMLEDGEPSIFRLPVLLEKHKIQICL